jgi:hypothetical protein
MEKPWHQHLLHILHIAGACAALGGSYGIIFSNAWNLYILATNNHLFFSSLFATKNIHGIPFACVLAEGFLCFVYLLSTYADQITLQQISVLGITIAFTLSIAALIAMQWRNKQVKHHPIIAYLGLCSCLVLLFLCVRNILVADPKYMALFGSILASGVFMFWYKKAF